MKGKIVYIDNLWLIKNWDEWQETLYHIRRWREKYGRG